MFGVLAGAICVPDVYSAQQISLGLSPVIGLP